MDRQRKQRVGVKKKRIGLDLHGVILNDGALKSMVAAEMFQISVAPGDFTSKILVQEKKLLTGDQYAELQRCVNRNDFIGRRMPLVSGVKKYLPQLAQLGQLVVVTGSYGDGLRVNKEILERKKLLRYLEIHSTGPAGQKHALIAKLDLDYYLDDDCYKLQTMIGLKTKLYLMHWNHNSCDDCRSYAIRVASFFRFFQLIRDEAS